MRNLIGPTLKRRAFLAAIVIVAGVGVLCPIPVVFAIQQTDPIDYSDPNMAMSGGYVSEASSSCIRKSGQTGAQVTDCMKLYKTESDASELRIAEKKKLAAE